MLDDESPTPTNLGNDHGSIVKEYSRMRHFGKPKAKHESLCSKWTISYHCGESCSSNMVSKSSLLEPRLRGGVVKNLFLNF